MKYMNKKVTILFPFFSTFLFVSLFSFSELAKASLLPQVSSYKIGGKQESVRLNPSRDDVVSLEINANIPVKFNTIAICVTNDAVCSRTTAVKYFTQTDFASLVNKEWNGKTSKGEIVPDGDYKIKVTIKDETEQENIQELSPYIITIDSSFTGGSGGSSSSVSQGSSSQTHSSIQTSSPNVSSRTSYFVSVNSSSSASSISAIKYSNIFEVSAGNDRLVYTDIPTDFTATAGVPKGFSEQAIKYVWSFGDGSSAEGKKVSHTYKFPGDYIVVLSGSLSETSIASRANIKAINPSVSILNITGDSAEIANQGTYEINLKGWSVSNIRGKFVFLSDTIIAPNKKITVPDEYMKLSLTQGEKIFLLNPSGKDANSSSGASWDGLSSSFANASPVSNTDNDPVVRKIREFIATGGKSSARNSSLVSKNKTASISVSEKNKIISSSSQPTIIASSQVSKRGFIRSLLNLPFSGFSLIKRVFYSGN